MSLDDTLRRARQHRGEEFHGVSIDRAAINLRDERLSLEASDAGFAHVYREISRTFEENELALANVRRSAGRNVAPIRIMSDVGFSQVQRIRGGVPFMFFVAPKAGGFTNRRRGEDNPIQICMHSFGLTWSRHRMRSTPGANAPAADSFGYNPYRFMNGIREMVKPISEGGRTVGVHHFVSRRGDVCNMVPWDSAAYHAGQGSMFRSLGLELETHLIRDPEARGDQFNFETAVPPYTQEQLLSTAFIIKKMMAWTPDDRILRYFGIDDAARRLVRSGAPGMYTHKTVATNEKIDAYLEFEFPPGYKKGDPYPNHPSFSTRPRQWDRRIERFHADKPRGKSLSAWDDLFNKVRRMRSFNIGTEVFDSAAGTRLLNIQAPGVTGAGPVAAMGEAARVRTVGVIRSQDMAGTSRAGLYQAARGVSTTAARTWDTARAGVERVTNGVTRIPIIANSVCFNYTTGRWVNSNTANAPVTAGAVAPIFPGQSTPGTVAPIQPGEPTPVADDGAPTPPGDL